MSYFRFIDNGEGPVKLFVGGIHGKEGNTTIKFFKSLLPSDFYGKAIIYNFDESPYISTLDKKYYSSAIGKELISIIKRYKPDFYTELHCYNEKHYQSLIDDNRRKTQGVPPLIELNNKVLTGSASPLIRTKLFSKNTVCKIVEIPCNVFNSANNSMNENKGAISTYLDFVKLIAISKNRTDFEKRCAEIYPKQVDLAIKYAKELFGEYFPPF
ncbi:MAG: DUF2119 domain-containing protein [Methanobrevibacter sp.]|jgi:hypothetical protein|nr:DUF2119 domain-containing protein [Methanobrevibacter sp.]